MLAQTFAEGADFNLPAYVATDPWFQRTMRARLRFGPEAALSALDHRAPSPVEEITPGWFGRWFIRTYIESSSRSRRAQAPRKIAPASHVDLSVVDLFLQSNQAARDLVRRASAYDVNRLRFRNPFVPVIRFTVGTGLEIIWRHQRRHLLQAERIKQSAGFPAG